MIYLKQKLFFFCLLVVWLSFFNNAIADLPLCVPPQTVADVTDIDGFNTQGVPYCTCTEPSSISQIGKPSICPCTPLTNASDIGKPGFCPCVKQGETPIPGKSTVMCPVSSTPTLIVGYTTPSYTDISQETLQYLNTQAKATIGDDCLSQLEQCQENCIGPMCNQQEACSIGAICNIGITEVDSYNSMQTCLQSSTSAGKSFFEICDSIESNGYPNEGAKVKDCKNLIKTCVDSYNIIGNQNCKINTLTEIQKSQLLSEGYAIDANACCVNSSKPNTSNSDTVQVTTPGLLGINECSEKFCPAYDALLAEQRQQLADAGFTIKSDECCLVRGTATQEGLKSDTVKSRGVPFCEEQAQGECIPYPGRCNCGIKLNTSIPFIGNCIMFGNIKSKDGSTTVNSLNAFPILAASLMRILMAVLLLSAMGVLIAGGAMMTIPEYYETGKEMVRGVVYGTMVLGASGTILYLINPTFFQ